MHIDRGDRPVSGTRTPPPQPVPEGVVERWRGFFKIERSPPTDEEFEKIKEERLEEKCLK